MQKNIFFRSYLKKYRKYFFRACNYLYSDVKRVFYDGQF